MNRYTFGEVFHHDSLFIDQEELEKLEERGCKHVPSSEAINYYEDLRRSRISKSHNQCFLL